DDQRLCRELAARAHAEAVVPHAHRDDADGAECERRARLDRVGHQPCQEQPGGHADAADHRRRRVVGPVATGMLDQAEPRRVSLQCEERGEGDRRAQKHRCEHCKKCRAGGSNIAAILLSRYVCAMQNRTVLRRRVMVFLYWIQARSAVFSSRSASAGDLRGQAWPCPAPTDGSSAPTAATASRTGWPTRSPAASATPLM